MGRWERNMQESAMNQSISVQEMLFPTPKLETF